MSFQSNTSLAGMDYGRVWLKAFGGFDQGGGQPQTGAAQTLAAVQVSPAALVVSNPGVPIFVGFTGVPVTYAASSGIVWYSGWLRAGWKTQMVGWVINTGNQSAPAWTLVITPYSMTSLSTPVRDSGYSTPASTTYTLTTGNVQAEILSKMYMSSTTGPQVLGFIYDASVGSYGQVTWIAQI